MSFFKDLEEKARQEPKIVVLPELGLDKDRVIQEAIEYAKREGTAKPIGLTEELIEGSRKLDEFVDGYAKKRELPVGIARRTIKKFNQFAFYGAMMVHLGYAHGMVAGRYLKSANVMTVVNSVINEQEGRIRSSIFFREPPEDYPVFDLIACADMVINQAPNAEQLYRIIVTSAETFEALIGREPRIALISYVTEKPSGIQRDRDPELRKITEALRLYEEGGHKWHVCQAQADAALIPDIARNKGAPFTDRPADLLIASNLMVANPAYKLFERLIIGGQSMIVTSGLEYPAMDVSRNDSASNIANVVAACSVQAQLLESQNGYRAINEHFLNL